MRALRSTRHAKITGDLGESLILYLLSLRRFESVHVDHTGIDIIARRPRSREILGISVKSRSRRAGQGAEPVLVTKADMAKAAAACRAFGCRPYFAFFVDTGSALRIMLVSSARFAKEFPGGVKTTSWRMSDVYWGRYWTDPTIETWEFRKAI